MPLAYFDARWLRWALSTGGDQYIFNADFRNAAVGSCWRVRGLLDNGEFTRWSGAFKLQK